MHAVWRTGHGVGFEAAQRNTFYRIITYGRLGQHNKKVCICLRANILIVGAEGFNDLRHGTCLVDHTAAFVHADIIGKPPNYSEMTSDEQV